jgi:hypothetical protein
VDEKRFESKSILDRIDELDDHTKDAFKTIHVAMLSAIIEHAYKDGNEELAKFLLNTIDKPIERAKEIAEDRIAKLKEWEEKRRGEIEM